MRLVINKCQIVSDSKHKLIFIFIRVAFSHIIKLNTYIKITHKTIPDQMITNNHFGK